MEAVEDGARWRVCGCSSEDAVHAAANILREDNFRIWQTAGPAEEAWIEVEARNPTAFKSIEVLNAGASLIEVFALSEEASARMDAHREAGTGAGKEIRLHNRNGDEEGVGEDGDDDRNGEDGDRDGDGEDGVEGDDLAGYEVVMTSKQMMSNKDLAAKSNRDRCMHFKPPRLSPAALQSRWRRLRIICKQPYGGVEDRAPIGLARIKITPCSSSPSPPVTEKCIQVEKSTEHALPASLERDVPLPIMKIPFHTHESEAQGEPAASKTGKRKLPDWAAGNGVDGDKKKQHEGGGEEEGGPEKGPKKKTFIKDGASVSSAKQTDKILAGMVFAISGIENPERAELRDHALEMGAEYRRGWEKDCTLLLCAFPNTPKFREVKQDGGTIVSHKWVQECYRQKQVVPMDSLLMCDGRPWRKGEGKGKGGGDGGGDVAGGVGRLPYTDGQVASWVQSDIKAVEKYLREQEDGPDDESLVVATAGGMTACFEDCLASLSRSSTLALALEEWPEKTVPTALAKLRECEGKWSKEGMRREVVRVQGIYAKVLESYMKKETKKVEGGGSDATELLGMEGGSDG